MAAIERVLVVLTAGVAVIYLIMNLVAMVNRMRKPKGRWIQVLALCLLPSVSDAAGRVFSDGFEDGTHNAWNQSDFRDWCDIVTSALDAGAGPHAKKFCVAWLLWCVLAPPLVYAAPSISGVSGTVTHGGSITITGSSFGSKGGTNANKPLLWADFETSINPSSLGHLTTWDETENLSRQTSAPQYGISAGNVIGTWSSGVRSFSFGVTHTMTKLYQSGKRRMSAAGTDNQKFFRIWNDASTNTVASTSNGGIILDELCVQSGRFQAVSLPGNAWEMHEFLWKQSTSNDGGLTTGNGYFEFLQNGSQEMYLDDLCTHTTANYGQGNKLRVIDTYTDSSHLQPDGTNVWMDDLYVDDTWARVIIGNASTLATSTTTREVQIPSAWSANSITVTVNRGAFGASANAYLYVVDSNNAVNATGYAITFGAGGGGGTLALFLEWAMVIGGLLYHVRKPLLSAVLVLSSVSTVAIATTSTKAKHLTTQATIKALTTLTAIMRRGGPHGS